MGEFAHAVTLGTYVSLWANYHLKELAQAGGLSD